MQSIRRLSAVVTQLGHTPNQTEHLARARFATMSSTDRLTIESRYRMNSGYEIPVLGYGVYQTPADIADSVVQHAFRTGYRHVDSAAAYRNEKPCAQGMIASGLSRDQMFFTSKIPPRHMNYNAAKRVIDETVQSINLASSEGNGLGRVDLMLLYAPYGGTQGRLGAWRALVEGVEEGKIRSIGVSNYGVHHLQELEQWISETEATKGKGKGGILSVNQVELHPWLARPDIVEWCEARGILLEAYSPLARASRLQEPVLHELGKKHGKSPAQILIRWSLQKVRRSPSYVSACCSAKYVSQEFVPLPKSVTPQRIDENADVYDFQLSDEDMGRLHTTAYESSGWDPTTLK